MRYPFTPRGKRVVTALLALLLTGPAAFADTPQQNLQQLKQQIEQIQSNLQRKSQLKSQNEKLLERTERQIASSSEQLTRLQQQQAEIQLQIQRLRARRADILAQSQEHRRDLKTQVRAHYLMGRNHHLKLLLDQQDPARLGRSLVYYNYFNEHRGTVLDALGDEIDRLRALEDELAQSQQQLQHTQSLAEQRQAEMQQQQAEQKTLIQQLIQELGKDNRRLEKLQTDEKRLSELTSDIYESVTKSLPDADRQKPFGKLKGDLPWPVKGKVQNSYGSQRGNGGLRWNGLLITAAEGTPVRAVARGQVVFSNWLRGYGFLVIVDHGSGYMSLYGHNRQLLRQVGDTVARGDALAQVGNSGGREENALYFEIRRNGKTLNPRQWIARR